MKKSGSSSIFKKIFIAYLTIGLFIIILSGIITYREKKDFIANEIKSQFMNDLYSATNYFENVYKLSIKSDLALLAAAPSLNQFLTSQQNEIYVTRPAVEKLFLHFTKSNKEKYLSGRFIDAKGMEKIIAEGKFRKKDYTSFNNHPDDILYKNIYSLFETLKNDSLNVPRVIGPFKHKTSTTFLIGIRIKEPEGEGFGGAIIFHCDLKRFFTYLSTFKYRGIPIAEVSNSQRELIYSLMPQPKVYGSKKPEFGRQSTVPLFDINKDISIIPGQSFLTVHLHVPASVYALEIRNALLNAIDIALIIMALVGVVAYFISREISRPIRNLMLVTNRITEGDRSAQVKVTSTDEIGQLTESFNAMVRNLQQSEEKLTYDALHDSLTGLPNRSLLMDRLNQAIERSRRDRQNKFAVLFVDLDRFKMVNDSLGHHQGDKLLIMISKRFQQFARSSDTVARLGGDEFIVLMENINGVRDAIRLARRIQKELKPHFSVKNHEIYVTASIGIVMNKTGHTKPDHYLRDADIAMYRAKTLGQSSYQVFDRTMHDSVIAAVEMETELRNALTNNEFILHYQPIFSISKKKIVGVEALLRWQHPEKGLVLPLEFVPIAEETGLIVAIGRWVIEAVCLQCQKWMTQKILCPQVSINVSSLQFEKQFLPKLIKEKLSETKMEPKYLAIEITESVAMNDIQHTAAVLGDLSLLGIKIAIDDFGVGYSSLNSLIRFPIDTIKIDRSFVQEINKSRKKNAIIKSIIAMARTLEFNIIAEGVEQKSQLLWLEHHGCDLIQGYHVSYPLPEDQITNLLLNNEFVNI